MVTKINKNAELTDLMKKSLAGDAACYKLFLEKVSAITRKAISRKIPENEVEDVLQEILISIHKAKHTYDGNRPVVPWVLSIVSFRVNDYLRVHYSKMQNSHVEISTVEDFLFDVTFSDDSNESVIEVISDLPEKQKNILILMHVEGYTAKEVAKRIGMNESAVKVSAHRAYKVLKEKIWNDYK
jgi:RNA polymerase sigma-70 factor (ECF subfamily)